MSEEKRTLIETFLPVDEISAEAKKEKLGTAKPRTFEMHYWWTRKPLITARAAVLGALLPADFDQREFKKLLGLEHVKVTGKRAHNYDIPLERIDQLKQEYKKVWGEVPTVLDPFAGGGSIPFEAMRVGTDAISIDYNPVAYLIERATLEYPKKYSDQLLQDVEKGLNWVFEETKKEMGQYYPKHNGNDVAAYIWAWSVKCPSCGFDNPLVGQWWLVNRINKKFFLQPKVVDNQLIISIKSGEEAPEGTSSGGKGHCLSCGAIIPKESIKDDISKREMDRLLAVVISKKGGKEYALPSTDDIEAFERAKQKSIQNWNNLIQNDLVALEEMPDDNRGTIWAKVYLKYWYKLLNPRQLLLFSTIIQKSREYQVLLNKKYDPEYSTAIITYLSFILAKLIDYNSRSTNWLRAIECQGHVLASRGLGISWDHSEVNPFVKSSGTLITINKSILDGVKYSIQKLNNRGNSIVKNGSITQLNDTSSIIVTDPPYFDDVQYAELSEFFFVWERKILGKSCEHDQIVKTEDMSIGGNRDKNTFNKLFNISCKKIFNALKDNGIVVLFFAHSSIEAWDFVINSLQKNGFKITATWPIHTESTNNPIAKGNASIMSSIIIVARKRKSDKSGYIEEIQDEVKAHLIKRLDEFWRYGLRGADLTVSAMGATLDIITQYSEIKSYTGEMQIKDVLELVQKYVAQYVLDRYMKNASGLDAATSFYLYTRLSQLEGMPFDTANLIAKSMNVDLKTFEKQGLIRTIKGGKAQGITLLNYANREVNEKQSLIDCVQFVMATFARGGFTEIERELATIPFSRTEIKDVLEALMSLPTEDPERQIAQKILERMGQSFPKQGQTGLDNF